MVSLWNPTLLLWNPPFSDGGGGPIVPWPPRRLSSCTGVSVLFSDKSRPTSELPGEGGGWGWQLEPLSLRSVRQPLPRWAHKWALSGKQTRPPPSHMGTWTQASPWGGVVTGARERHHSSSAGPASLLFTNHVSDPHSPPSTCTQALAPSANCRPFLFQGSSESAGHWEQDPHQLPQHTVPVGKGQHRVPLWGWIGSRSSPSLSFVLQGVLICAVSVNS